MKTLSPKPNLQLLYVSDIERSTAFYKTLFNAEPLFLSSRYVAFTIDGEALFAIWTGGTKPDITVPRFSEIGIMLPSSEDVDQLFKEWQENHDIKIVREPYTEIFGLTFLAADPDGHIIRVCPLD
jgi:predicted enzyme related to lactoylglutathione lyase